MKNIFSLVKRFTPTVLICFVAILLCSYSAQSQQMPEMNKDSSSVKKQSMNDYEEIAHPFFTHMGIPEAVGTYSLRTAALLTQVDGKSKADFALHFETGLSKFVGLHIRNDRFFDNSHSEIMFQFAVIRSIDGMSGFSPIIEFEIPTKKDASRVNTLVGFSSALVRSRFSINQVLHYNPREDMLDGSIALVYKVTKGVFLVVEMLGDKMQKEPAIINVLAGVKVKVYKSFILGFGYQHPITNNKDFSSQYIFQPDMEWKR